MAFTASRRWVTENGAIPITALIAQAIAAVEPLRTALADVSASLGPRWEGWWIGSHHRVWLAIHHV